MSLFERIIDRFTDHWLAFYDVKFWLTIVVLVIILQVWDYFKDRGKPEAQMTEEVIELLEKEGMLEKLEPEDLADSKPDSKALKKDLLIVWSMILIPVIFFTQVPFVFLAIVEELIWSASRYFTENANIAYQVVIDVREELILIPSVCLSIYLTVIIYSVTFARFFKKETSQNIAGFTLTNVYKWFLQPLFIVVLGLWCFKVSQMGLKLSKQEIVLDNTLALNPVTYRYDQITIIEQENNWRYTVYFEDGNELLLPNDTYDWMKKGMPIRDFIEKLTSRTGLAVVHVTVVD